MTTDSSESVPDDATAPFWAGLREGVLDLPRCRSCAELVWYPRSQCPRCMSADLSWERLSGRGTVYSFTVNRRGQGAYRGRPPFVLAYVELEEGPRVMSHVVGVDPEEVRVGVPVRLSDRRPDGEEAAPDLLRFEPAVR